MKKTSRRQFNSIIGKGIAGATLLTYAPFGVRSESFPSAKSLGVALVGLGSYSQGQLAPSLEETRYCHLAGIVTGTPAKAKEWKAKYKRMKINTNAIGTAIINRSRAVRRFSNWPP